MLRHVPSTEKAWAVGIIERQLGHLTRLVDDLLDIAPRDESETPVPAGPGRAPLGRSESGGSQSICDRWRRASFARRVRAEPIHVTEMPFG